MAVALVALAAAPAAHAWTPAQAARALRAAPIVSAEDDTQADRPVFQLSFARLPIRVQRAGPPQRFRYRGPAHDVLGGGTIAVSLTFEPDGAGGVAVDAFRGPLPDASLPDLPLRAAFYYGWFPEVWFDQGFNPFTRYDASAGEYNSADPDVIRGQIAAMRYGKIGAGIYSWWGQGSDTDLRFPLYLGAARETPFRWALYYEAEGYGDPSPERIHADLAYIRDEYASSPAYLRLDGRFVVFVYGGRESCSVAGRWRQANEGIGAYLVLPAFEGFRDCASQPDSWHFYSASIPEFELHGYSFGVCPGFWRPDESPRLPRDLDRFRQDVRDMVASNEPLQLVLTFNEWGEGTAVEAAQEWRTPSGYGAYLDALHDDGR